MKRSWRLDETKKADVTRRYVKGEPIKNIAKDYQVTTKAVCIIAFNRTAYRRYKVREFRV